MPAMQLFGRQRFTAGLRNLLNSLENPLINRHVVFALLDLVVALMVPPLVQGDGGEREQMWRLLATP